MDLKILFEDAHIVVCYKPSGIAVQTKKVGEIDMVSLLKRQSPYIAVIHRLDQPVEGVLVFAKTPFAAKELNKQLQSHQFGKHYKAVVQGEFKEVSGRLEHFLCKDARTNTSRVCDSKEKDAKKASLFYEVERVFEREGEVLSQVKIQLETGRHHQIRVQMAAMGTPIWGDTKYGPQTGRRGPVALCAYRLEFKHPKTGKQLEYEIEPKGEAYYG